MKRRFSFVLLAMLCITASANAAIWSGETDGHTLHRDPFCRQRGLNNPNPFANTFAFENAQAVWDCGEWMICTNCSVDTYEHPALPFPESFSGIWNAELEVKTSMLPGVWTLPSEQAVSPEEACQTAKNCAAANPELSRYLNEDGLCTASVFHYDAGSRHAMEQRETYKVLVTTPLRESIGIISIDALSGEVYGVSVIPYDDFQNLYSN